MRGFCPLASGSKGNAIFVGSAKTKLLIDAGISAKRVMQGLAQLGVDPNSIQAILVTHEHTDHIAGLATLSSQLGVPVVANAETAKAIVAALGVQLRFQIFVTGEIFQIGDIEIASFSVPHDALDPVGFVMQWEGKKVGFCTDLGHATSLVKKRLERCDYLYLEANHQVSMVHACSRPTVYKERVLGRQGHLSNDQCAQLLRELIHPNLKHVHLAHLSSECNAPQVALEIVGKELTDKMGLSIAFQDQPSKAIHFFSEGD